MYNWWAFTNFCDQYSLPSLALPMDFIPHLLFFFLVLTSSSPAFQLFSLTFLPTFCLLTNFIFSSCYSFLPHRSLIYHNQILPSSSPNKVEIVVSTVQNLWRSECEDIIPFIEIKLDILSDQEKTGN